MLNFFPVLVATIASGLRDFGGKTDALGFEAHLTQYYSILKQNGSALCQEHKNCLREANRRAAKKVVCWSGLKDCLCS